MIFVIFFVVFVLLICGYYLFFMNKAKAAPKLVIQSGFESDVSVYVNNEEKRTTFVGTDHTLPSPNSWDHLNGQMVFHMLHRGPVSHFEIVPDPLNPQNKVAKFQIIDHLDGHGRAQASFLMGKSLGFDEIYNVHHVKYRQYIPWDYEALKDFKPIPDMRAWTDFFEIWSPVAPAGSVDVKNPAGAFRIHFEFVPNNLGGFEWHLRGEDMEYKSADGLRQWIRHNYSVAVPFGKWTEWDIYIVKGSDPKVDSNSSAQVVIKMKPDGEEWQTLFQVTDERTQHSWITQDGYYQNNIFKNYLGNATVQFLKDQGKTDISLYYDDVRFSVNTDVPPPLKRNYFTKSNRI